MVNNNYNFGLLTNSSALKTISFTVNITPSNSFTLPQLPADYKIDYYYTGDNNTISGIQIINKNNKPFLIIPSTQIAGYISSSAVYVITPHQSITVPTTFPQSIAAIGENQKYILDDIFSMSSGLYPFPFTFYIID